MPARSFLLLVPLVFILLGCEYPGVPHPLAAQAVAMRSPNEASPSPAQTPVAAEAESQTPAPTADETPTPADTESESAPDSVQISLKDFHLDPDTATVKAGTVTFVLKNEGRYTHDFRVNGQGIDEKAPKVGRGRTREWQATLPPGTYRISCPISNHADRGMTGTLTVVE